MLPFPHLKKEWAFSVSHKGFTSKSWRITPRSPIRWLPTECYLFIQADVTAGSTDVAASTSTQVGNIRKLEQGSTARVWSSPGLYKVECKAHCAKLVTGNWTTTLRLEDAWIQISLENSLMEKRWEFSTHLRKRVQILVNTDNHDSPTETFLNSDGRMCSFWQESRTTYLWPKFSGMVMISGASKNSFSSSSSLMSPLPEQHWSARRQAIRLLWLNLPKPGPAGSWPHCDYRIGTHGRRNKQLQFPGTETPDPGESAGLLSVAENHLAPMWTGHPRARRLTFSRTSTARSVRRQHRGPPEGPLQVIVLLRQLFQGLFQSDTLVSFILKGLLPLFTMGLG